uniref:Putative nuclease HARBI1 n=1 Tax=Esox lucius TaxID=8010 RepID=A0AAY5KR23_ESOLU
MCQSHWPAWSMNLFLFQRTTRLPRPSAAFFFWGICPILLEHSTAHVHIQAPCENEWEFINRKGRHSINVQLVCDPDLIITNCFVKWPGSVHDARILRESALYRDLQTNQPDGIILGDSAYPLLPWLMTPFLTANTPAQARFNTAHCRARCAIERLNGVLKRRFACLNYLRAEPQKACNITLACIVLHNIATKRNVPLCADNDAPEPLGDPNQPPAFCQNEQTGPATRDAISDLDLFWISKIGDCHSLHFFGYSVIIACITNKYSKNETIFDYDEYIYIYIYIYISISDRIYFFCFWSILTTVWGIIL